MSAFWIVFGIIIFLVIWTVVGAIVGGIIMFVLGVGGGAAGTRPSGDEKLIWTAYILSTPARLLMQLFKIK